MCASEDVHVKHNYTKWNKQSLTNTLDKHQKDQSESNQFSPIIYRCSSPEFIYYIASQPSEDLYRRVVTVTRMRPSK